MIRSQTAASVVIWTWRQCVKDDLLLSCQVLQQRLTSSQVTLPSQRNRLGTSLMCPENDLITALATASYVLLKLSKSRSGSRSFCGEDEYEAYGDENRPSTIITNV